MHSSWKRAGLGVCTVTAVALAAALGAAPAQAATPTGGLLGGVTGGLTGTVAGVTGGLNSTVTGVTSGLNGTVTGVTGGVGSTVTGATSGVSSTVTGATTGVAGTVTDLLNGLLAGSTSPGSPVGVASSNGMVSVDIGGTGLGVRIGAGASGTATTGTVAAGAAPTSTVATDGTPGSTTSVPTRTVTTTDPVTGQVTTTTVPVTPAVSALRITSSVDTVYPAKDGYRDSVVLHVTGTTAAGTAQPVSGVVVIKRGTTEVKRWTIGSSTADLTWDGRSAGRIVAGAYTVTGVAVDATGTAVAATDAIAVSAKKLVTTTQRVTTRSVSGTHAMAAKAKAGLKHGKVLLRVTATATGVVGKQYLVFTHKGKHVKVLVRNGTHTSKAITVPKAFTTYRLSHTWKTGTVSLKSAVYKYTYKKLK